MGNRYEYRHEGMGKDTKIVAHEGISTGTGIFSKYGYRDEQCSTLPIGGPLSFLLHMKFLVVSYFRHK